MAETHLPWGERESLPWRGQRLWRGVDRVAQVCRCPLVASGWMTGRDLGKRWWAVLPPSLGGAGRWVAIPGLCGGQCVLWPGHNRCYLTMRSKPEINSSVRRGAAWLAGEQGASPGRLAERSLLRWLGGQGF